MIILDTNVLSEVLRPTPEAEVLAWLERQTPADLYTTTVTEAEVFFGIEAAPIGRKRDQLRFEAEGMFEEDFDGRVLAFDRAAARAYGRIVAARKAAGRPVGAMDAQILAIASCRDATVATRDVSDFEGCGVRVVNPWTGAAR
jgi:predicted nucleic acid-binding protein